VQPSPGCLGPGRPAGLSAIARRGAPSGAPAVARSCRSWQGSGMESPHDKLFKLVYSRPAQAAAYFERRASTSC